jgi:general secretion pathway protein G
MPKTKSGFTIVELLIVIVVIGILAAITIVAYNGFQERAKNAQTTQAISSWIKGLILYKADRGQWPAYGTCLGTNYTYGPYGTDTTGVAQCRQTVAGSGYIENTAFKTAMAPYIGSSLPTPAFVTARASDTNWYRGLTYVYGGGAGTDVYIQAIFAGAAVCPSAGSGAITSQQQNWGSSGNTYCHYLIGQTTDT